MRDDKRPEKPILPEEIIEPLIAYLKDEIIRLYHSKEGQEIYKRWKEENKLHQHITEN